jgi:hypothetical protein
MLTVITLSRLHIKVDERIERFCAIYDASCGQNGVAIFVRPCKRSHHSFEIVSRIELKQFANRKLERGNVLTPWNPVNDVRSGRNSIFVGKRGNLNNENYLLAENIEKF